MHAAEIPFGGGVSQRFTRRLKGQSTVEYVLIIAIIVLVVLIVGQWVSSAIRNQFNLDYRLYPNTSHIHPHMYG